jgi:hypothetical protein
MTRFCALQLLIAENLCLRQQLAVLQRRHPRPRLSDADRRFWILASRWFSDWRNPLLIVKPETVLGCSERVGGRTGGGDRLIKPEVVARRSGENFKL